MEKYYDITRLASTGALYRIALSGRSTGKTYQVLMLALNMYFNTGKQLAIIKRCGKDFDVPHASGTCFNSLMCDSENINQIDKMSHGKYKGVIFSDGKYYLAKVNKRGVLIRTRHVIAIEFCISNQYEAESFKKIGMIMFDEFINPRDRYIDKEYELFDSLISTILGNREDVPVYMLAETSNVRGCIYFKKLCIPEDELIKKGHMSGYTLDGKTFAAEYRKTPAAIDAFFA